MKISNACIDWVMNVLNLIECFLYTKVKKNSRQKWMQWFFFNYSICIFNRKIAQIFIFQWILAMFGLKLCSLIFWFQKCLPFKDPMSEYKSKNNIWPRYGRSRERKNQHVGFYVHACRVNIEPWHMTGGLSPRSSQNTCVHFSGHAWTCDPWTWTVKLLCGPLT